MKPDKIKKLKKIGIILGVLGGILIAVYLVYILFFEGGIIFHEEEQKFHDAAEEYYFHYPSRLPKNEGDSVKVTLQELYDLKRIEFLNEPKSITACSPESWVRVFMENGEYKYYTYLECGNYRSATDHEGPQIVLNGDNPMYISLGTTFTDPGIASVKDNADGEIDTKNVRVDTSSIDINRIGEYTVRYTAFDKMQNRTDVTRTVNVIRNIKDEVIAKTDESNAYKGAGVSNYLLFSGMLWRIVKVNDDGTIKLILDDNAANLLYRQDGETFEGSNVAKWLNDYFYPTLRNTDTYVKSDSTWCESTIGDPQAAPSTCENYTSGMPVGMLTIREFLDTIDSEATTYFNTNISFWLLDHQDDTTGYAFYNQRQGRILPMDNQDYVGVRPVINLKTDNSFIISGDGSADSPYKLNDYQYGRDNDMLKDRYIGEYINYSGQYFRIIGFDENQNIKVISAGPIRNSSTNLDLVAGYDNYDEVLKFDPSIEGNLGYKLNYELGDYINGSLLVEHEFERSYYDTTKNYSDLDKDKFTSMLSIPNSYDLFSGSNNNVEFIGYNYSFIDVVNQNGHFLMVNTANGQVFDVLGKLFPTNSLKIVAYISKDARLAGGRGTATNPYYIK